MCGERNLVGTPVICVYAPDTRRQYYCFPCWNSISQRAEADVPSLAQESDADVQMIGMIFGVKEAVQKDRIERHGKLEMQTNGTIISELDIKVEMDTDLFEDGIPFKRYHLTGGALAEHVRQLQEV